MQRPLSRDIAAHLRRMLLVVTTVVALAVGGATGSPHAAAHAVLLSTSPGPGEVVDVAPTQISLLFSEPVELSAGAIRVLDVFGKELELGRARHQGDDATVVVDLPSLADGGYAVGWKVVSADGHPIDGAFTFSVGTAAQPGIQTVLQAGQVADGDGWAGTGLAVARAAVYAGIALLVGTWAFVAICWWDRRRHATFSRSVVVGGVLVVVGSLARLWLQSRYVGASFGDVLDTSTGTAWAVTAAAAVVAVVAALVVRRAGGRALHLVLVSAATLVVGYLVAHGGHGSVGRWSTLAVVLTIAHVATMAFWSAGLVALLLAVRRAAHDATESADVRAVTDATARFSRCALVAVAVLVATGVVQGARQIEDLGAIGRSPFGRALLVKLVVVVLLLVAAIASRRLTRTSRRDATRDVVRRLRRSIAIEAVLALAAIGVTGQLAGASPVVERAGAVDVALVSGDQIAYVTVTPSLTGPNQIHISLASASGAALAPDRITLQLTPANGRIPPIDVPVELIPPAHATAEATTIPFSGRWELEVTARYGEFRLVTFSTDFEVD